MGRKVLPGIRNTAGQPIRVTVGAAGEKQARIIDPNGVLTYSIGHTAASKAAMSEMIRKSKAGEIEISYP
ncbi:hypothetical protein J2T17_007473 [Paenibacillus mucilaginosus]|uniref:hypothetical protein n=1 Tax=Paenibacillus mucilaginosus TaxID=61624 RepID=UPI003D1C2A14